MPRLQHAPSCASNIWECKAVMAVYRDMDQDELERQYNARATVPDVEPHLARYAEMSAAARHACQVETDLAYGTHPDETFDFFPAGPAAPLFIFIHGGYWRALSKDESSFMAPCFNAAGIAVAAVNYSLAPDASLDQIVDQVRRCVVHIWSEATELQIDPDRIFLCGTSAGGHLAAMVMSGDWVPAQGTQKEMVAGACLISGLYDLEPVSLCLPNTWLNLGAEAARSLSPATHPAATICPVQVAWAGSDTDEFKRQSRAYADALSGSGHVVSTFEVSDRNHFDIVLDLADPNRPLTAAIMEMIATLKSGD